MKKRTNEETTQPTDTSINNKIDQSRNQLMNRSTNKPPRANELSPYKVAMNDSCILRGPSDPEHEYYQLTKGMEAKIVVF